MAEFSNEVLPYFFSTFWWWMNCDFCFLTICENALFCLLFFCWKICKILTFCCCDLFSLRFGRVNLLFTCFACFWCMACWEEKKALLPNGIRTENTGKNLLHRGKRLSLINSLHWTIISAPFSTAARFWLSVCGKFYLFLVYYKIHTIRTFRFCFLARKRKKNISSLFCLVLPFSINI